MEYHNPALPNDLYTAGAQRVDTRDVGNMLMQEQRVRKVNQMRNAAEVDKIAQSEIGKVRNADVPGLVGAYNDWKDQRKKVYFDKNIQRDPQALAQAHKDIAQKYSNFMQLSSASQQQKAIEDSLDKEHLKDPNRFEDDYATRRSLAMKTPMSNLGAVDFNGKKLDFTNADNYLYKGPDTDFGDLVHKAAGEAKPVYSERKPVDASGLQEEVTPWSFGASPAQVKDTLLGNFGMHGKGRDAAYLLSHLPEGEYEKTMQAYAATPADKLKKAGLSGLPDLTPHNGDSEAEKIASYLAAKDFLSREPKAGTPTRLTNDAKKLGMEQGFRSQNERLAHGFREEEIKLRDKLKDKGAKDQESSMDAYLSGLEQRAQKSGEKKVLHFHDKDVPVSLMDSSPSLLKSFEKTDAYGQKVVPWAIGIGKDGQHYPIFVKKGTKDNPDGSTSYTGQLAKTSKGYLVMDDELSTPVDRKVTKAELANTLLSPKLVAENLQGEDDDASNISVSGGTSAPKTPKEPAHPKEPAKGGEKIESLRSKYKY